MSLSRNHQLLNASSKAIIMNTVPTINKLALLTSFIKAKKALF